MNNTPTNQVIGRALFAAIILITCMIFQATVCPAQRAITQTQANFLLEIPDARGRGLAGGGSVYSAGAVSAYYNPANLAGSGIISGEFNYSKSLPALSDDLSLKSVYLSRDFGKWGYYGFNYDRMSYGEYTRLDEMGNLIETGNLYDYAIGLSGAIALNSSNFIGLGLKYVHINITSVMAGAWYAEASTFAFDFGFLSKGHFPEATIQIDEVYYPILRKYFRAERDKGIILGLSLSNIGPDMSFDNSYYDGPLPRNLRLAAGYQILDADHLGLRFTIDALKLLVNTDNGFKTELREVRWVFGVEATFLYMINLRAGRFEDDIGEQRYTSVGIGLGPEWLRFDYSRVLESDTMYNRRGEETSYSLYCNFLPYIFER